MSSMYSIAAILVLDGDGERIAAKHYSSDLSTLKEQRAFEKNIWQKTYRANAEIIMYENVVAVYKSTSDVYFYVLGSYDENELLLASALNCLFDALGRLLRGQLDKRTLLENLDFVLLAIDELCDDGVLLEADAAQLAQRVSMKSDSDIPLSEQTVSQAMKSAKSKLEDVLSK